MYAAWKKRPWKQQFRSYSWQLLRYAFFSAALILLLIGVTLLFKGRAFSPDDWKTELDDMALYFCISLSALSVGIWEKVRNEEKAAT
ncbi:hypothetical protein ACQKLP_11335 [Chitinophaga sp. NPDC101104]|uniref:hypothetical protein n=1 Tax=Chitinophaga sp. NPDC101104 TaxID=3390561 RepID=UPI003D06EE27